jgi:hypothetical protein
MNYIAKWGPMGFVVSPTKIIPFNDFSTSVEVKTDESNDTNGNPPTNVRGRELQTMQFSTTYLRAAGVDPRARYDEWESLAGQSYPLYIGGKRFGPAKMMLASVSISELTLSHKGDFLSVSIDITLTEDSEGGKVNNASSSSGGASKKRALSTTASSADKKRLAPNKHKEVAFG